VTEPYIPWKDRKRTWKQNRVLANRHQRHLKMYAARKVPRLNDRAFDSGIEKLIEFADAWDWLESIPHYLWFPRNRSVECLPEFQAQGMMHDNA